MRKKRSQLTVSSIHCPVIGSAFSSWLVRALEAIPSGFSLAGAPPFSKGEFEGAFYVTSLSNLHKSNQSPAPSLM